MDAKLAEIQRNIDSTEAAINAGGVTQAQLDVWNMQLADFNVQKNARMAELQTQAASLQDHVQAHGYTLDSITIADVPVSECGLDEPTYNILREKVEAVIVGQATTFSKQLADQQTASQAEAKRLNDLNSQLTESSIKAYQENIQYKADNESISTSRDNAARMLDEANAQITQLNSHIADLQAQIAVGVRGAIQVESTDEQIKQQEQALKASRIKVLSMVKNDPSGVSDRLWDIVLASNGEKSTINYLEKGKYTVISAEEAAQAQADIEASKNIPELTQIAEEPAVTQNDFRNADPASQQVPVVQPGTEAVIQASGDHADATTQTDSQKIGNIAVGNVAALHHALFELAQSHEALKADNTALTTRVTALESVSGQAAA